jgi:aminopeptidase N
MIVTSPRKSRLHRSRPAFFTFAALLAIFITPWQLRADEPYARSRDYNLQHSKIALRFDTDQKKVLGDVTHTLSILRDGTTKISFDSVGLTIQSVILNKSAAKFETSSDKLIISLPASAKRRTRGIICPLTTIPMIA